MDTFDHRTSGTFDHRTTGTFDHRTSGTFDHCNTGTFDEMITMLQTLLQPYFFYISGFLDACQYGDVFTVKKLLKNNPSRAKDFVYQVTDDLKTPLYM